MEPTHETTTPVSHPEPVKTTTPVYTKPDFSAWSWGGFMFDPIVIIAARKYVLLFAYLLCLIPLINVLAIIVIKIYMGLNARAIVKASALGTDAEKEGFLKGLDHAGWILFLAGVAVVAVAFLMMILGGFAMLSFFHHGPMMHKGW